MKKIDKNLFNLGKNLKTNCILQTIKTRTMKNLFLILVSAIISIGNTFAQGPIEQHPLVGMWQYATTLKTKDGRDMLDRKPIYKIINNDNTYSVIFSVADVPEEEKSNVRFALMESTILGLKGTYEIENDSVYTEFVTNHYMNKSLTATTTKMNYRFCDSEKNILRINCYNESLNQWIPEIWTRIVPAHKTPKILEEK